MRMSTTSRGWARSFAAQKPTRSLNAAIGVSFAVARTLLFLEPTVMTKRAPSVCGQTPNVARIDAEDLDQVVCRIINVPRFDVGHG
jgi:hypothetical protein